MDRNSAIGLTVIAVLILLYLNFFSPAPKPEESRPAQITATDTTNAVQRVPLQPTNTGPDSSLIRQYGALSTYLTGTAETIKVENNNLAITFSNSGTINQVELKNFKTYSQKPLYLVTPATNWFTLKTQYDGKEIDLYHLYYQYKNEKRGDTTVISFTANVSETSSVRHIYTIPSSGYVIGYQLEANEIAGLNSDQFSYQWSDKILLQEKDLVDSRNRTTINYYTSEGNFEDLSDASKDLQTEVSAAPIKWTAIRQKFFISAVIAKNNFSGGEVSTVVNEANPEIVKDANIKLFIPKQDVNSGKAKFDYYFGPNDYEVIKEITPGFSRNLPMGWPPVIWVNKFLILPIFQFLTQFISNYGIIIVILVLIIKLILSPLSYKSYIGMAKMKLLKPELDVIKEKYGDNMTQIQAEQMKLYQQVGVSPFSGCIPLLLQMPILLAMFYFFPYSIELRQKGFLWAEDLSTYDSIANLPFSIPFYGNHVSLFVLLMTISTIISTWQNNQVSSVQGPMKSMGYLMPVIFMFVLNSFSAALSFYYFVSNVVTFAQQAIIKAFVDDTKIRAVMDDHRKKMESGAPGTGTKSKFMSKLQDAMKASEEARKNAKK